VTDHRVPVTLNNLPSLLSGEQLGDVIDSLEEWHLGARLKALMAGEDADIND
jgi:protein subunit release factor A